MNKKYIILITFSLIVAATAYLAYNRIKGLEDLDFSDPFETDFDDN